MSANTLNNRSIGQTILDTFFNDIHSALDGDFVGRGATGIPTAGQNLGTLALPWGVVYAANINLNGSSLDTSKIVSAPNRVVSGKTRSGINQPAFITPNGAAASCLIAAATTNLILSINGAGVTVNTDITKGSLTLAPSSNNTAAVNDSSLAGSALTKLQGERGSPGDITIGTVGSNISGAVGKWKAFKLVHSATTEYFLAYVESTTKLSHCYRGFFYDSSLNPINPVAISSADTITLMNLGWLFMTNDATTVDVTYNTPVWSATSPSSPATGDYWYDMVNQTWKRYDGASFQIINRTWIGMVVLDSSNCVAARSVDFANTYAAKNTFDLEVNSGTATIIQAKRANSQINVKGQELYFGQELPTWVGANNYVSSTDYYAAFAISTNYYLYIKDDGTLAITDIAPIYRNDLYGWYARHAPWRCIAIAATDGSSNWAWVSTFPNEVACQQNEILLLTANGYGSTNTKIRQWTTVSKNIGLSMTLVQSATLGDSFVINEDGIYSISYFDQFVGADYLGLSVNSTQLTTAIDSVTNTDVLGFVQSGAANDPMGFSTTVRLKRGDVVRCHGDGAASGTRTSTEKVRILRVS